MNILHTLGKATGSVGKLVVSTTLKGTGSFMSGFTSSFKAPKQATPTNYVPAQEQPVQEQATQQELNFSGAKADY
jgi:hypothetical protein